MSYDKAQEAANFIESQYNQVFEKKQAEVALVLGSGLGAFADEIENRVSLPYETIPSFVRSTVEGHAGQLILGEVNDVPLIVQQGRFHYYEGYSLEEVTFPMRVFGLLGVKTVILTNAAGSINTDFKPGSLMLIADHINMMGVNPLRGRNDDRFGTRFPDMTEVYSLDLQELTLAEAKAMNINLRRGVYCALSGPSYETPAEIRMLRNIGADAVGMSTVPEVIAAKHMSIPCAAVSVITDECDPDTLKPVSIIEIIEVAGKADEKLSKLFYETILAL
jgi:purine-nucleoside phosphorylase